ncbi:MAG: leucyl aminopeptidase [Actinomycetota bacterium]
MADFSFSTRAAAEAEADLLVLPVFQGPAPGPGVRQAGLQSAFSSAKLTGKRGETLFVPGSDDARFAAGAVLLVGVGERAKVTPDVIRRVAARAAPRAAAFGTVATTLPQASRKPEDAVQATVEGFVLGSYRFDRYRTAKRDDAPAALEAVEVLGLPRWNARACRRAIQTAQIVADATCWARDLVNTPALDMPPDAIAREAQKMAKAEGLKVKIWKEPELTKGNMGGILGVGQGSVNPPRMIELHYSGAAASQRPIALSGKGIAFDSGGLSLKDAKNMEWMKSDMGGAASILATMRAIARLEPKINVVAAIPSSENMPSGSAIRPGDVLHHRNGKTSEVLNTDAEGRLVLADALAWLAEQDPVCIIDTATLTGACMVALGEEVIGAFGNDPSLTKEVIAAGDVTGEPMWELPLRAEYRPQIDSAIADVKNVGPRWGGAITAALFLEEFVDDVPWVHLDIAGPAFAERAGDLSGFGGTGVPVRSLVRFVLERAGRRR